MRQITAVLFVLAVGSSTAYAVDGVILIDQNRALAGNVTPGDAPGFPITISQRGSYRLLGILSVPTNTNAIELTVSDVTIDLNGFSIMSVASVSGSGVRFIGPGFASGHPWLEATPQG